jgi:threonyl-tRNA synthetase
MKKKSISLHDIRNMAMGLLSLAVKQRFPAALCRGGRVTPQGFYCDFSFQDPFKEEYLRQIEEVMLSWVRQKLEVQVQEMVGVSAKEYFLFHKEPFLAEFIEGSEASSFFLLKLAGMGMLLETGSSIRHLGDVGFCHLQKSERAGARVRIYGTAFFDKQDLKKFLKEEGKREIYSHQALGLKNKLFFEESGSWIWLPLGERIRTLFKRRIEEEVENQGFLRVSTCPICEGFSQKALLSSHEKIFKIQNLAKKARLFEVVTAWISDGNDSVSGLFQPAILQGIHATVFCPKKDLLDELISSLHFMTKIFKILDFASRPIFFESRKGKDKEMLSLLFQACKSLGGEPEIRTASVGNSRIEWHVQDSMGQSWQMAYIHCPVMLSQENLAAFSISPCVSFERAIALLLEKEQGKFPVWLES